MTSSQAASANARINKIASDPRLHRAFHWLHIHSLQMRQWQLEMLAIPAPTFHESARAAWFLDRFHHLGLTNLHLDSAGNALATLQPTTPARVAHSSQLHAMSGEPHPPAPPRLLLSAHLDTVFPPNTNTTPREDGPRILAPGASDNAAGLTALLAIAAALQHAGLAPACPILFAANTGEEGAGDLYGMKQLFAQQPSHNIAAALALEGSGHATIVDRALGSRRLRITLTGPGGHSWADAAMPNPIFILSRALAALSRLELPSTPRTTLHCGTINGGTSVNSIPQSVTAELDLRSVSAAQLDLTESSVFTLVRDAVETADTARLLTIAIDRIGNRPAAELASDSPLLASVHAVDRHLSIPTASRIGSTDANLPLSLGVPALAIGAGGTGGGIHTLQEWFDPTARELALRRILLLVLDTCHLIAEGHLPHKPPHQLSET